MKNRLFKNLAAVAALLILCGICAAAVALHSRTAPADALEKEGGQLAVQTAAEIQLGESSENANLSNKITQAEKERRQEEQEKQEQNGDQNQGDGQERSGDPNDPQQNAGSPDDPDQTEDPENPDDPDNPQNPDDLSGYDPGSYTDLPEDAFVEESLPVDDLLKEIGIDDADQIIYAKAVTGDGKSQILKLVNGAYSALLSTQGTTIIQIKYTDDDGNVKTFTKKITYKRPEGSTPEKKRPVINTNLKDQATYSNQTINFDVWVTNYRGKPLSYNNMEVTVNGRTADYVGEMDRQTYRVKLQTGANEIRIKVTDSYQYTVTKVFTVYYKSGSATITISLEAGTIGLTYLIEPQKMEVDDGTPLSDVIDEFLTANGCTYEFTGTLEDGFYLAKIRRSGLIEGYKIPQSLIQKLEEDGMVYNVNNYESLDTLGEFDFARRSGWMYSINGLYSSYGLSKAYVENGDVVRIRFTLAGGKDIGAGSMVSEGNLKDYGREW